MSPKEVSVLDMMEARDRRAGLQRRMTAAFHVPVISFTMNIAGPVKRTPLIRRGFALGLRTAELPPEAAFAQLRAPGRDAEGVMLEATGGVNTHKGAIFSVGLVSAALGRLSPEERKDPAAVLSVCAAMTKGLTERAFTGLTPEKAPTCWLSAISCTS